VTESKVTIGIPHPVKGYKKNHPEASYRDFNLKIWVKIMKNDPEWKMSLEKAIEAAIAEAFRGWLQHCDSSINLTF